MPPAAAVIPATAVVPAAVVPTAAVSPAAMPPPVVRRERVMAMAWRTALVGDGGADEDGQRSKKREDQQGGTAG